MRFSGPLCGGSDGGGDDDDGDDDDGDGDDDDGASLLVAPAALDENWLTFMIRFAESSCKSSARSSRRVRCDAVRDL